MSTKPTSADASRWATDGTNNTAPSSGQKNTGWTPNQIAVSDYMNVLSNEAYKWHLYLEDGDFQGAFSWASWNVDGTSTGSVDDYDIADNQVLRIEPAGPLTITGFDGGTEGRVLVVVNAGNESITLAHDDSGSDAENRLYLPDGVDLVLLESTHRAATFLYDATSLRWRLVSATPVRKVTMVVGYADGTQTPGDPVADFTYSDDHLISNANGCSWQFPLSLPVGATVTAVRVRSKHSTTASWTLSLLSVVDGVSTQIDQITTSNGATAWATDSFSTGLPFNVSSGTAYKVLAAGSGADANLQLGHVQVEHIPAP